MDAHTHGPAGEYIPAGDPDAGAEAAADAATEVAETVSDAEVKIARINADRDRDLADKDLQREAMWQEGRVAELEATVRAQQELLDRLAPPPEPAETVIVAPEPPAEPETAPAPEPETPPEPPPAKKKSGWSWF